MEIVNRKGIYNDLMFDEMAEFAQHIIKATPYNYDIALTVDGKEEAVIEDVRVVFNKRNAAQVKFRVAESEHKMFGKSKTFKIVITPKAPSKEPATTIEISKFFEETSGLVPGIDKADVVVTPNKWLYCAGEIK